MRKFVHDKETNNMMKLNFMGNLVIFTPCVKFLYLMRNSSNAILETAGNTAAAGEKKQLVHTAKAINTTKNFLKSTRSNTPQITVSKDKNIIIDSYNLQICHLSKKYFIFLFKLIGNINIL